MTDEQQRKCNDLIKNAAMTISSAILPISSYGDTDVTEFPDYDVVSKVQDDMINGISQIFGIPLRNSEVQKIRLIFETYVKRYPIRRACHIFLRVGCRFRIINKVAQLVPKVLPYLTDTLGKWIMKKFDAYNVVLEHKPAYPVFGDVICVSRYGGCYEHYGIYENDNRVYEYATEDGDFHGAHAVIRVSSLEKFIGKSNKDTCFALEFADTHHRPRKRYLDKTYREPSGAKFTHLSSSGAEYHCFTPKETVERARQKVGSGEHEYNLLTNNCEHFALFCKTGIKESYQVKEAGELIKSLLKSLLFNKKFLREIFSQKF